MTLLGAFVGGVLSMRFGVMRIRDARRAAERRQQPAVCHWLAGTGNDVTALIAVVSADNPAGVWVSAAFIAHLQPGQT